jgi:hypothetical protein
MLMIARGLVVNCCSHSTALPRLKYPSKFISADKIVILPSRPTRGSAVHVRAMVQIPARKVEVQEEAVCIAKHAGVRLDALLPDLFGSRYSSASGRAVFAAAAAATAAAIGAAAVGW